MMKISKKEAQKYYEGFTMPFVYNRDALVCGLCGNDGTVIHHIFKRSDSSFINSYFIRLANPENCITLCEKCHALVHSTTMEGTLKMIKLQELYIFNNKIKTEWDLLWFLKEWRATYDKESFFTNYA
jgi:hypothetical protein